LGVCVASWKKRATVNQTLAPFDCGSRARVVVTRGTLIESEHYICYAAVDRTGGVVERNGDITRPVYMRSSAKPMIATAVVASGAADRFGFTDEEIAIIAGSHSGEAIHVQTVQRMLGRLGLGEDALHCGAHAPTHGPSAEALCAAGRLPTAVHNNCSGKHSGILALALQLGAEPGTYLSLENAAQREIMRVCSELLAFPQRDIVAGVDGCGIPVIAVPLQTAAHFYARLGDLALFPPALAGPLGRVRDAMIAHPQFVAGTNRFDTDLMVAARPNILAKGGAEGYHGSSALERGLGMCVKVADGNYRAVAPFVVDRWSALGILGDRERSVLEHYRAPKIRNHAGTVVGDIQII
jgi:L-asparaginase II